MAYVRQSRPDSGLGFQEIFSVWSLFARTRKDLGVLEARDAVAHRPGSGVRLRVKGYGLRVSGFGSRFPVFMFRGSVFGLPVLGFGFRVSVFGFRFWIVSFGF